MSPFITLGLTPLLFQERGQAQTIPPLAECLDPDIPL